LAKSKERKLQYEEDKLNGQRLLGHPEEILARMIDGLYSLNLNQPEVGVLSLDNDDLKLLEKMKFNGDSIFKTGIEKYRVAQKMLTDGLKIEEIKAQLLDAEEFEYEGISYSWPKAEVNP